MKMGMKWWCFFIVSVLHIHQLEFQFATAVLAKKDVTLVPPLKATTSTSIKTKRQQQQAVSKTIPPEAYLSTTHYLNSCPNLEGIIQQKVNDWVRRDHTLAASIIRLHFHDCAVRGCDASILLNHAGSERRAGVSKTLRGFNVIDEIKAEVEKRCPKTVSCADILTAAARDATVIAGGPFWEVPFGRKDGRISVASEAESTVPQGRENITALIDFFQARGLNILDLVILSGSHTIGRSTCHSIRQRLSGKPNPSSSSSSINNKYLNYLKKQCKWDSNYVDLDVTTPRTFDAVYYANLGEKMGLLLTDQLLYSDARTAPLVAALASESQPSLFTNQFAVSMVKLGNVQVLTGRNQGEIRLNCSYVNP